MVPISDISGISARDAAKIDFRAGEYIWLAEGAPEMDRLFGKPLSAGCSYLLKREAWTFTIAGRWRIGRYRWGSYRDGWSATTEAACH